ncbi:MAG: hypothetical protein JNM93_03440 [Bacteriovoracaceae bacterium]|nr:hypothetical protein [Bacteriovoracaceae bacterium]
MKSLQELYLNKDYQSLTEQLVKSREAFTDDAYYYNLGTVKFKQGDIAAARYYFEKSLSSGNFSSSLLHNLFVTNKNLQTSVYEEPVVYTDYLYQYSSLYPMEVYLMLSLILVTIIASFKKFFSKNVLLASITISFIPFLLGLYGDQFVKKAIVMEEAKLREGPSQIFSESTLVPSGLKIILGKEVDGWFYIESPVKFSGWVKKESIGIL